MARKRKEKSLSDLVLGLVLMVVPLAIISPVFRGQVVSAFTMFLAVILLLGIVGLVVYLIKQVLKSEDAPTTFTRRDPALTKIEPRPDFGPCIYGINHTMQPSMDEQNKLLPRFDKWEESVLSSIEWKRFEVVTKEFLTMTGYEARETKIGADGGVDIRVTKLGPGGFDGIVQCKAWNTYKVGVKPVRELFGIMAAEKVTRGMLITSGVFTSEAEEFAKGKMTLVSGGKFLEHIRRFSEENQQKLFDIALEGDYRTPTCPQCDLKMTVRDSKKGRNIGGQFWGCVHYPRCKQTFVYK